MRFGRWAARSPACGAGVGRPARRRLRTGRRPPRGRIDDLRLWELQAQFRRWVLAAARDPALLDLRSQRAVARRQTKRALQRTWRRRPRLRRRQVRARDRELGRRGVGQGEACATGDRRASTGSGETPAAALPAFLPRPAPRGARHVRANPHPARGPGRAWHLEVGRAVRARSRAPRRRRPPAVRTHRLPEIACGAVSYFQAIVIAVVQGVTELFPVSSLGHSVLVPAWIGGSWQTLVTQSSQSSSETSFYLAYIVALHVATALALLVFFRDDWIRIIRGFFRTLGDVVSTRRLPEDDNDARLAWLIIIATIPVGITGLALEHVFRTIFAKPVAASIFLTVNGLILFAGERFRRRASVEADAVVAAQAHGGARTQEDIAIATASDVR
ncbi:MAG: undecaprenyl-diphosphate phosphatase, partial [Actinobacteria bacterium]